MAEWSSKNSDNEDDAEEKIPVGVFIEQNYSKFALIGIFVSVTLFLQSNRLSIAEADQKVGTAGVLLIYLVATGWIILKSFDQLTKYHSIIPGGNEIGYSIIAVGNLMLASVVVYQLTGIGQETQIVLEIVLSVLLINVVGNLEPVIPYEGDNIWEGITLGGTVVGGMVFLQEFEQAAGWYASQIIEPIFGTGDILIFHHFGAFLIAALFTHIGIYGVLIDTVPDAIKNAKMELESIAERVSGDWRVRTSVFYVLVILTVLTAFGSHTAETAIGPNYGYYQVWGIAWRRLLFGYWLINCGIASSLITLENGREETELPKLLGKWWVVISLLLSLITTWGITTGTHVMPI